jgi:hypothetical protein
MHALTLLSLELISSSVKMMRPHEVAEQHKLNAKGSTSQSPSGQAPDATPHWLRQYVNSSFYWYSF